MIKHYFKSTIRNILRQKLFSAINIIGLSISLAAAFLILLYVIHELSYDRQHKNNDSIYRVITSFRQNENERTVTLTRRSLGEKLQEQFPEIQLQTRLANYGDFYREGIFIHQETGNVTIKDFLLVDKSFFNIFTIPILSGNIEMLFSNLNSVFISKSLAIKYFEHIKVVGETIEIKNDYGSDSYTIAGVYEDVISSSTIQATIIGNMEAVDSYYPDKESPPYVETYLMIDKNIDVHPFINKINTFFKKSLETNNDLDLQPLSDIYFHSWHIASPHESIKGNLKNIYTFIIIAIAILLVASINYILMSTINATNCAVEIGIRKVLGTSRKQLLVQALIESFTVSIIAFFTAIALSEILLPFANQLFAKELHIDYTKNWRFIAGMILITSLVTIISGVYTSIYLSRFEAIKVLKKQFMQLNQRTIFRKALIVFQLIIFVTLILCTSIINKQIKFAQNKDLGFDRKNLIQINVLNHPLFHKKNKNFENEIKANPQIVSAAGIYPMFFSVTEFRLPMYKVSIPGKSEESIFAGYISAQKSFIETAKMHLLLGNDFISDTDSLSLIVNQTAAKKLGLDNPIGASLLVGKDQTKYKIIGMVKDFNIKSIHSQIPALIIGNTKHWESIVVRINEGDSQKAINIIEAKWDEIYQGNTGLFKYQFIDELYKNHYKVELNFGKSIHVFTILSIIIAFLGLFGLSTFLAKQKTKEIGIRKVYGASVYLIIKNVSKDLIKLTIIANLIAWPISWYLMDMWLQNFAYKIKIPYELFIITGLATVVFVIAILILNTYKAATANPVDSLRHE